jgi:hypothetical protein
MGPGWNDALNALPVSLAGIERNSNISKKRGEISAMVRFLRA